MNKSLNILLAFLIICQSISSLFIVAGFELNRSYISQNLCINKDKPALHCHGKCHLKNELSKDENNQSGTTGNQKEKIEFVSYSQVAKTESIVAPVVKLHSPKTFSEKIKVGFSDNIFKPPTLHMSA